MSEIDFENLSERADSLEREAARIRDYIHINSDECTTLQSQIHELRGHINRIEGIIINNIVTHSEISEFEIAKNTCLTYDLAGDDGLILVSIILRKLKEDGKCDYKVRQHRRLWFSTLDDLPAKLTSI